MATYFIGDIHGCYKNFKNMLKHINFDPSTDMIYLTGDLVSRGPNSLEVLRLIKNYKKNICTVLGNHDLHLLQTYFEQKNIKSSKYSFDTILHAPDAEDLIFWLRHQPILYINVDKKIIMTHAGIHPYWNLHNTKKYATEIEQILQSHHPYLLFKKKIRKSLNKKTINIKKLRKIQKNTDVFTKMRYVYKNGQLNMQYKNNPKNSPKNIYPWFHLPRLTSPLYNIIFGHWASLKNRKITSKIYSLDSGCCWGGELTALRWEDKKILHIPCLPPA